MHRTFAVVVAAVLASPLSAQDSTAALRVAQDAGLKAGYPFVVEAASAHANNDGTTTVMLKLWAVSRASVTQVGIPEGHAGWACRGQDGKLISNATFATPNRSTLAHDPHLPTVSTENNAFTVGYVRPLVIPVIVSCGSPQALSLDVAFLVHDRYSSYLVKQDFTIPRINVS